MSTLSTPAVTSNTLNTGYNSQWASLYDTDGTVNMQVPQIWGEIVKRYGPGIGLLEFLYMAGSIVPVAGPTKKVFEEGSFVKTVATAGASGIVAAGGAWTLHLAAAEFGGTTDNSYLSKNDIVVVPAKYIETPTGTLSTRPSLWQVQAVDNADGILKSYTLYCLNILDRIAVTIPTATKLMVTGGNYANGVDSGSPKSSGFYSRLFYTSTKKSDWKMTGSMQSNERYYDTLRGGGTGLFTKATIEADFLLSKYINDDLFLGGLVTATALNMTDRDGNSIAPTGTQGLLQHMIDGAMKQYYTLAYQYQDFDDLKPLLISQGIVNRNVNFFCGSQLYREIENAGLDFLKEFAGGTQLMRNLNELNVAFRVINKNGVYTTIKELPSLSDPTSFGADSFEDYFTGLGFIVPDVDVTVRGGIEEPATFKMKNLALGYKSHAGENRTRINKVLPGMASVGASGGDIAVSTYDDVRGSMLSEYMLVVLKRNQLVLVQNDSVLV
jgi:hypothetical protein